MPPKLSSYRAWLWLGLTLPTLVVIPAQAIGIASSREGLQALKWSDSVLDTPVHRRSPTIDLAQTPLPPTNSAPIPRDQPPSQQPLPEQQLPPQLPPPADLLEPTPVDPAQGEPPGDVPATITVDRFEVVGSTVFSPEQLAKVTEPFTKRPITLAELFQARTAVTELYLSRGYVTSGAYIPPQTLQDGVVTIQVVEGTIEDIKITGTRRLNPNYVRSRVALATGTPLNRDRLLEALQLLQLDPLIATLSAELSAGTRPGVSLLEVRVTEARTLSVQALLDNGRSPSVGTDRRQIQINEANLFGLGDGISVAYTNTDGSNAFDISYTLPINPRNGTLNFSYNYSDSDVIEKPFDILDIESKSRNYELTYRQPILRTLNQEIALGITATRRESRATLLDGEIPFPAEGSDLQGRTRISAVRFFQEWVKRNTRQVIAVRSQFSLGLDLFDSTINDDPPDSRFFSWRGQAQWVRALAPDTLLLLRGDVQLSDRPLAPLEQFGLGGIESVRGYRQDALLTDNGVFLSAEARIPVLRIPQWAALLQVTPFLEFGTGWNRDRDTRPNPDPNDLASIGIGLRLQVSDNLTARFDWGIPLISIDGSKDTWQEQGLYFSIIYNPF